MPQWVLVVLVLAVVLVIWFTATKASRRKFGRSSMYNGASSPGDSTGRRDDSDFGSSGDGGGDGGGD